jgi:hypothetical protein
MFQREMFGLVIRSKIYLDEADAVLESCRAALGASQEAGAGHAHPHRAPVKVSDHARRRLPGVEPGQSDGDAG